jgi:hypothetical protein
MFAVIAVASLMFLLLLLTPSVLLLLTPHSSGHGQAGAVQGHLRQLY